MVTHSSRGLRAPRLNPFAFPSDTSFRFALLIVFVVCGSLSLYGELRSVFYSDRPLETDVFALLRNLNIHDFSALPNAFNALEDLARRGQPFLRDVARWKIIGVVLTLTLATVIYWFMPAWQIRHMRLRPLSPQDVPDVTAYLEHLCREAGLSSVPTFMWNPLDLVSGAMAFGRLGRYYVGLTGGLVNTFYTNQPTFRAVMLHELAHLRNVDVNKTGFTVALWWAFVVTAILPSVVSLLWHRVDWKTTYFMIWFGIVSTALVLLTRNAVLRTREFYADVRASVWDGPSGSLRYVVAALAPVKGIRRLGPHPDRVERLQTLEDTYRLLRLGFWDAFGAGLAAAIIVKSVQLLFMGLFFTPELTRQPVYLWSFAVVVGFVLPVFCLSLAVGAVGIGVWRGAFATLVRGQTPHEAGRLGCALALGILSGELLLLAPVAFVGSGSAMSDQSTPLGSIVLLGSLTALGITLLFATLCLIFIWVAAAASAWLEVVLRRHSPSLALTISLVIASASVTVWAMGITFMTSGLIVYSAWHRLNLPEIPSPSVFYTYLVVIPGSVIYATSVCLWAFPLAAWLWRRTVVSESQSTWAFLEGESEQLALPAQAPIRPDLALIIGLAVGFMFCVLLVLLRYNKYIAPGLDRLIHAVDSPTVGLVLNGLSALMQASAAAIAAAWIRRLGALHGLCSASIAGYVITLGWMLFFADYAAFNFVFFLSPGTFLALPVALGVAALAGWIRRTKLQRQAVDPFS
jgi:Zn-dependent protease with chaperone function